MYLFQQHITSLIHDLIEVQPTSLLIIKIITVQGDLVVDAAIYAERYQLLIWFYS